LFAVVQVILDQQFYLLQVLHFSSNIIKEENFGSIYLETINSTKVKCIKHSVWQLCLASFHLFVYFALQAIFISSVCIFSVCLFPINLSC